MTPMPVLLQSAAQVQALPEEAAAGATELANTGAAAAATAPLPNDLSILELILHASIPVQIVMLLLLFASISSWVIIFRKKRMLDRAEAEADRFEERFWSGAEVGKLYFDSADKTAPGEMYVRAFDRVMLSLAAIERMETELTELRASLNDGAVSDADFEDIVTAAEAEASGDDGSIEVEITEEEKTEE